MSGPPFPRQPTDLIIPRQCLELIRLGALVALSSSGGKDSQAMTILLSRVVPRKQRLVVHVPLGEVEWPGMIEHIENAVPSSVPLIPARTASGKSLLERIGERGRFPDSGQRYCTSGTKRTPIERELRRCLKAHSRFGNVVVNATGMRASESPARSKLTPWRRSDRNRRARREWFDQLAIHGLEEADVFRVIAEAGQSPHWARSAGKSRLGCSFCIFASPPAASAVAPSLPAHGRATVPDTVAPSSCKEEGQRTQSRSCRAAAVNSIRTECPPMRYQRNISEAFRWPMASETTSPPR